MFLKNKILQILKTTTNLIREMNTVNKFGELKAVAAICHMRATNNKTDNLRQVSEIVKKARKELASFLFIPECCDFVGENREETLRLAEPLDGPTLTAYKELAKNNKIWISFGGVHEAILNADGEKSNKIHNTHVVINDQGNIVATYRKLHLFDVSTPEFKFRESDVVSKGREIVLPLRTPIGKLGLQICYDLRFSEVSTILRKFGAQVLTYPSAFAYSTGKAHWEVLLRARAIENQCYVIAPAQIGFHNSKRQSYGYAMIVDPWGQIVAQCKDLDIDVATAEIDLSYLKRVRQSMPCFTHRRNDAYSLIAVDMYKPIEIVDMKFGIHIIPAETIFYTSQHCFAFTNIRCVVPGHVLIATKRPAKRLKDLDGEEITDLFATAVSVQRILESFYNATSTTMTVQDGEDAGQTVNHVHFHVMPRHKGDFKFNDQIYVELNKHDHDAETSRRHIEEMIDEANTYRRYIEQRSQNFCEL